MEFLNTYYHHTRMEFESYPIELSDAFSLTCDKFNNEVLSSLQNYKRKAEIHLISFSYKEICHKERNLIRFCQILTTISKNKFFVSINFSLVIVPGILLAESIDKNQYGKSVALSFIDEGIQDVAKAISNDKTITKLIIDGVFLRPLSKNTIEDLSKAIRCNTGIQTLCIHNAWGVNKHILEQGIAFNKHIRYLEFCQDLYYNTEIQWIDNALISASAVNTNLLVSLHLDIYGDEFEQGMFVSNNLKKVAFTFASSAATAAQMFVARSIGNMPQLEDVHISFYSNECLPVSTELSNALQESRASIQLKIDLSRAFNVEKQMLYDMTDDIKSWDSQPDIIIALSPYNFDLNWNIFQNIRLTKLVVMDPNMKNFLAIVDSLPFWKQLQIFKLQFKNEKDFRWYYKNVTPKIAVTHHNKLAASIIHSFSIKQVDILWGDNVHGNTQAENLIRQSVRRNRFLLKFPESNGGIPQRMLPDFLESAACSLDFLYHYLDKHPNQIEKDL